MKPVQLLTRLCKEGKVDGPHFSAGKVRVGEKTFKLHKETKDPLLQQASAKSKFILGLQKALFSLSPFPFSVK